ncbi:FG-GAP repeat domain-containing protein [Sandaracinus amylolyticus]|uniref:FG-GAP repeat domain-containing protein n=1 Tax=Sandaracinus amylolyticus TaxID=927083 RepID=UPI001F403CEC|nr:VCBS repeat-containing protein [Sandaracinus amylolyticus]UJR85628.1 Hypothetical protein I5071_77080 [Sandaracinus amylolyticus]
MLRASSWCACVVLAVLAVGCDCGGGPARTCESASDCGRGQACIDGMCVAGMDGAVSPDGGADAATACGATARACGEACCAEGEVCGTDVECCARESLCGSVCCDEGQICEQAVCRTECGARARCHDESGAEICCGEGEVCASDRCFRPDTECEDFIDCEAGEYCEPTLGRCLPQPTGEECVARPTGGEVRPTLLWHWTGAGAALPAYNQVMMAPMVASLDDDDGDGDADADDVPDVVFNSFCGIAGMGCSHGNYSSDGVLRAVSGADGSSVFDVVDPAHRTIPGSQVAIGDIDGDGWNEIVTCASDGDGIGGVIAFHHDGSFYWRSTDARVSCAQAAPSIADLDADGVPEVFVRYTVLDARSGNVESHHDCVGTGGWATSAHNPCDYTTAADLDGDGDLEIVGGNAAYRADGSVLYDRTADFNDGYPAIGDLDRNGTPEIIVVHSAFTPAPYAGDHWLRVLRNDGTDFWPAPVDINAGLAPAADVTAGTVGGGGPPTIANFDDDPDPEIGVAGAYAYAVFEPDGTRRWASISDDRSSRKTGSSVFDFDGDGVAEVVYNDHYWLRVYDGSDGDVRFCLCNTTATLWEYPVVVDVDTDGHAEIVVASNDYGSGYATCPLRPELGECEMARITAGENLGTHGVRVFASPTRDWVGTRRIWNQHTYHVTNVSERGEIPRGERPNWLVPGLNDFRLNVQPGATNLPDPTPIELAVDLRACGASMTLYFSVRNDGWSAIPAGATIAVYAEEAGSFALITRVTTTRALLPGESERFGVPYPLDGREPGETVRFRVVANDDGDPSADDVVECRDANNVAETTASCSILF